MTNEDLKNCPLCPRGGRIIKTLCNEDWVIGCAVCFMEVSNGNELVCVDMWQNLPRPAPNQSHEALEALESMRQSGSFLPQRLQSAHYQEYELVRASFALRDMALQTPKPQSTVQGEALELFDELVVCMEFLSGECERLVSDKVKANFETIRRDLTDTVTDDVALVTETEHEKTDYTDGFVDVFYTPDKTVCLRIGNQQFELITGDHEDTEEYQHCVWLAKMMCKAINSLIVNISKTDDVAVLREEIKGLEKLVSGLRFKVKALEQTGGK